MKKHTGYVYRHWIINNENIERSYIGKTIRKPESRWGRNGNGYLKGKDTSFSRAIGKYGWESFNHDILLKIECETREELDFWLKEWEKYYIWKYDSYYNGYNDTLGGDGSLGCKATEEHKKKNSEAHKGEKNPMYGKRGELAPSYGRCGELHPMYGKKGELSPNYGRVHSDEYRLKIKERQTGLNNSVYKNNYIYVGTHIKTGEYIIIKKGKYDCEKYGLSLKHMSGCARGTRKTHGGYTLVRYTREEWEVIENLYEK